MDRKKRWNSISRESVPEAFDREKQHSQQQTPQLCNYRHVFNQRVESWEEDVLQVIGMPNIDRKTRRVVTTLKK